MPAHQPLDFPGRWKPDAFGFLINTVTSLWYQGLYVYSTAPVSHVCRSSGFIRLTGLSDARATHNKIRWLQATEKDAMILSRTSHGERQKPGCRSQFISPGSSLQQSVALLENSSVLPIYRPPFNTPLMIDTIFVTYTYLGAVPSADKTGLVSARRECCSHFWGF